MNKLKKIFFVLISMILAGVIIFCIYYFFMPKKYTFYIEEDIGTIQGVELDFGDYNNGYIKVYDIDVINEVFDNMEKLKAWPYYSFTQKDDDNSFHVGFMGQNNKRISFSASDYGDYYVATMGVEHDGKALEEPIWDFIGRFCVSKEDGDRLYELVSGLYLEYMRDISVDDIKKISKEKMVDWRIFEQFQYVRKCEGERVQKGEFTSDLPARFQIEGKKGYVMVWYFDGIIVNSESSRHYYEVFKAMVYNENGDSMDLYDEKIDEFLEEME